VLMGCCFVGQDGDMLSLIKLASIIEVSAKKGTRDLKLQDKLMDQVDWLPDSIGRLSSLILGIIFHYCNFVIYIICSFHGP
jgi:hypothetical protein